MLIAPLLALAALADGNFPPPDQLIERAIAAGKAQEARALRFTWREDEERRDPKGKPLDPFLKTYDVIMLEGDIYRKLILKDGHPLDAKTAKKVEQDLEKTREERRKHRLPFLTKTVHFSGVDQLVRLFDNKVTGEEIIEGRKAWRVESDAKQGLKPANAAKEEELLATHRITWFDEEDGVELRHITTYIRAVHKIGPTTSNKTEWSKVGDAWLPSSGVFHFDVKIIPGITGAGDVRYRYYDYKRFTAESTFTPN